MKTSPFLILSLVLLMSACDATDVTKQPEISTGTQWHLLSIATAQDTLRADTLWRAPMLRFGGLAEDGSYPLMGSACVHYQGRYTLEGNSRITVFGLEGAATEGCDGYPRRVYAAFFEGLRAAESYEMHSLGSDGNGREHLVLRIYFDGGRSVMHFETSKIIL